MRSVPGIKSESMVVLGRLILNTSCDVLRE